MQGYSINGYLNAVRRRSAKTVMVEGASDSSVLTRLKRALGATTGQEPSGNIDVAGLLTDESLKGLGKREIVRSVLAAAASLSEKSPEIQRKFGTLQDREWDGLEAGLHINSSWAPPLQSEPHFTTTGHSIENYFFKINVVEAYLRFSYSDDLGQDFFNDLHARFKNIIVLAAVYSLALKNISSITKGGSLLNRSCISREGDVYHFTDALPPLLAQRSIVCPPKFVTTLNEQIEQGTRGLNLPDPARWICHGHLGEDAIWACIAHLAHEHTGKTELAQAVERGTREARFKHAVDQLSREESSSIEPLGHVVSWLTRA